MSVARIKITILLFLIIKGLFIFSQESVDSLVAFSDLKFHSDFEKEAFTNYIFQHKDSFMLFMANDENMTKIQAQDYYQSFQSIFEIIKKKKLGKSKNKKDIAKIFILVHEHFLHKYDDIEHFPDIFTKGNYNCVSASILYALIFNQLQIPYKIFQTPNHVYLVVQPGKESLIIETTNPDIKKEYFTQENKKDYLQKLKSVKMVTENESLSKSIDEIFQEKYYKSRESEFKNLFGFEYMNKALSSMDSDAKNGTYELFQKAYFFFPDPQVRSVLYKSLIQRINNCKFKEVSDIDYLVQLMRYENVDNEKLINIFIEIINYYLQFTDKNEFCDSLYYRLVNQIKDKTKRDEIGFAYYLNLSRYFKNSDKIIGYIEKAIAIKQNHIEANNLFIEQLEKRLDRISGFNIVTDSIEYLEKKYNYKFVKQLFADYRLIAYLNQAYFFFSYNRIDDGEYYLTQFEAACASPVSAESKKLIRTIETTYRTLAIYYYYQGQKQLAQRTIDRGLKFVPGSRYIQTAIN
jgi:hypothetical protein